MKKTRLLMAASVFLVPDLSAAAVPALCYQSLMVVRDKYSGERDELFDSLKLSRRNADGFDFKLLQYARNYSRCRVEGHATRQAPDVFVFQRGDESGATPCAISFRFDQDSVQVSAEPPCSTLCSSRFPGAPGGTLSAAKHCAEIGR